MVSTCLPNSSKCAMLSALALVARQQSFFSRRSFGFQPVKQFLEIWTIAQGVEVPILFDQFDVLEPRVNRLLEQGHSQNGLLGVVAYIGNHQDINARDVVHDLERMGVVGSL